jgi:hypothetical protein
MKLFLQITGVILGLIAGTIILWLVTVAAML